MAALTSGGGEPFTFSAGEQAFYQEKGFTNEPGRCASCRRAHKATKGDGGYSGRSERTMYPATCSECGKETKITSIVTRRAARTIVHPFHFPRCDYSVPGVNEQTNKSMSGRP